MGHHIAAILLQGPYDASQARDFKLRPISLTAEITLIPLDADLCDAWADTLGITGFVSDRPRLNRRVVHHFLRALAPQALFAVIETDYLGVTARPRQRKS